MKGPEHLPPIAQLETSRAISSLLTSSNSKVLKLGHGTSARAEAMRKLKQRNPIQLLSVVAAELSKLFSIQLGAAALDPYLTQVIHSMRNALLHATSYVFDTTAVDLADDLTRLANSGASLSDVSDDDFAMIRNMSTVFSSLSIIVGPTTQ